MIEITSSRVGRVALIEVKGRIDSINAGQLRDVLEREIRSSQLGILLDMAGVNHVSAAGLRVLRDLYAQTGDVYIVQPSDRVREVLQITGLNAIYQVYESRINGIHTLTPVTNAHTHLELGWMRDHCPGVEGAPFVPWIRDLTLKMRTLQTSNWQALYEQSVRSGIERLIETGTTTVGEISSRGISIGPLLESGLRGVAFVEVAGADPSLADDRLNWARDLIDRWRPQERNGMRIGLGIHAPYSTHPKLWRKLIDYARKEALPVSIHIAESPAEHQYLTRGTGFFADDFYDSLKVPPIPTPMKSPAAYLEDLGALELKPLLAHAVEVDDDDIQRIKASGSTVVHCPRSNLRLQCRRMPLEKYLEQGVPVLLGTDSLSSSPSLNIFDELEIAVALHHGKVAPETVAGLVYQPMPF